ncbi:MAG: hypothetical protein J0I98_04375 [Mesorhizobium sp.]|nr:hypothetical protein [Mesorhizobium sp.]MBN9242010.1 hypothetical protein [Mesorhizobium sp.]
MNRKRAAAVLSALLYAQGLLGFAGLAALLMKAHAVDTPIVAAVAAADMPALPC